MPMLINNTVLVDIKTPHICVSIFALFGGYLLIFFPHRIPLLSPTHSLPHIAVHLSFNFTASQSHKSLCIVYAIFCRYLWLYFLFTKQILFLFAIVWHCQHEKWPSTPLSTPAPAYPKSKQVPS